MLADRIVTLSIRAPDDTPLVRMPDGNVRIAVRTDDDAQYATVLTCPSDTAPGLLADLARVLTEAGDHPEPWAFVHAEHTAGRPQSWAIASAPPGDWPG